MAEMSTADLLSSFGTQPIVLHAPKAYAEEGVYGDGERVVEAKWQASLVSFGHISLGTGWAIHPPTGVVSEPILRKPADFPHFIGTSSVGGKSSTSFDVLVQLMARSILEKVELAPKEPNVEFEEDLSTLAECYELSDAESVTSFLRDNPRLLAILFQAVDIIAGYFTEHGPCRLEVFLDPEESGQSHLRLLIPTRLPVDEALDQLTRMDEEWLYEALPVIQDKMIVDLEFV